MGRGGGVTRSTTEIIFEAVVDDVEAALRVLKVMA